jgi:stage II sporulation protein D
VNIFLTILVIVLLVPGQLCAASGGAETIRVAIFTDVPSVVVAGESLVITDADGLRLTVSPSVTIGREKQGLFAGGIRTRALKVEHSGIVRINGKGFRGAIEVVPAPRGVLVIAEIPLEHYLVGLINSEISSQWPIEAVKAQAVVARSYALFQKGSRKNKQFHLESTVNDQVYAGSDGEDSRAARAVEETRGQVLVYDGRLVQTFFHANCGGHTEAAEHVWSAKLPYLRGVVCAYCTNTPAALWQQTLPRKKIETMLRGAGYQVVALHDIRVLSRFPSGRIRQLLITSGQGTVTIPAVTFRKVLGSTVIRSTNFTVAPAGDDFYFSGTGYGHGVGLCQWGAKQRAEEGFTYREILAYYYPGTRLIGWYAD